MYNCFGVNTSFVASNGVKSFTEFSDGDETTVLTHTGLWKRAVVRNYGKQPLCSVVLGRGKARHEVSVTRNHRWLLKNGSETINLQVGDQLRFAPDVFSEFVYGEAPPDERLYWAYGFIYGDGTRVQGGTGQPKYSMVRLCGQDVRFLPRFKELGFNDSSSLSLHGDVMVYTGTYLKTLPDPDVDDPRLIRAFVRGYLDADGTKNKNGDSSPSPFLSIQATGNEAVDFIRRAFPVAGVYIVSETDLTGQITNFGTRPYTVAFRTINGFGRTAASFTVVS